MNKFYWTIGVFPVPNLKVHYCGRSYDFCVPSVNDPMPMNHLLEQIEFNSTYLSPEMKTNSNNFHLKLDTVTGVSIFIDSLLHLFLPLLLHLILLSTIFPLWRIWKFIFSLVLLTWLSSIDMAAKQGIIEGIFILIPYCTIVELHLNSSL